jgi:hypothetical protein
VGIQWAGKLKITNVGFSANLLKPMLFVHLINCVIGLLAMADWKIPNDEELVRESVRKIIDVAERVSKKNGTHLPFIYSNYASRDQDPLTSYGKENLMKLKHTAKKYDPHAVFQTLQNDGWLVSKSREQDTARLKL